MHNLKEIRKNFDNFKKSIEKRTIDLDFVNLEKLDKDNRGLIRKTSRCNSYTSSRP